MPMPETIKAALIIGVAIVLGAAVSGGRYSTSPVMTGQVGGGGVYVVDRFIGSVRACHFQFCRELPDEEQAKASAALDEILKKAQGSKPN